jgi:tetratricopeptide (TPR) repeat protein
MMRTKFQISLLALAGLSVGLTLTSCMKFKQTNGSRASGQSRLMDESFAAQNACNPDDHTRPFIIEWDATDMSSFESFAANDIVIVKYEGCKLRILDECKNDSIRGSQGAYKPPEWTSGSLETLDIHNEGELYAKLPLGQATLGGRVSAGESFHMEYYVAGTVNATRDAVYRDDLASNQGCDSATHFVYGYNLGAFALGSTNEVKTEVGGSAFGFGAGGGTSSGSKAEKKGGDLATCKSDSATEVQGCKTPIRLNLRSIRDGENPEVATMAAPDDAASLSAAGVINTKLEMSDEARAHYEAANAKAVANDGKGCLKELDAHDKLDANHKSTDPKSYLAMLRSQCVMRSGKCDAGKGQMRKALEATMQIQVSPEQLDSMVDSYAQLWCQGDSMSERDQLLQALQKMTSAAFTSREDVKFCDDTWAKIKKLMPKVKPKDEDDSQIINAEASLYAMVPLCYQRAGDCKKAYTAYQQVLPQATKDGFAKIEDPKQRADIMRSNFDSLVSKCKDK